MLILLQKFLKVVFALAMAAIGISQSSSLAPDSSKAKSATASVFAILDRKSKIDPGDDSGLTPEILKGNIEIRHVSFRYPTRPDIQIFQDMCLSIHSGKVNHYYLEQNYNAWNLNYQFNNFLSLLVRRLLLLERAAVGSLLSYRCCSDSTILILEKYF